MGEVVGESVGGSVGAAVVGAGVVLAAASSLYARMAVARTKVLLRRFMIMEMPFSMDAFLRGSKVAMKRSF